MASTVENIKAKISIVDVIGGYLTLEKAGQNFKARCPFHNERTASFYVSPARQSFHCFGCNKGGDIFTFIEEIEGLSFIEALRLLAARVGIPVETSSGQKAEAGQKEILRNTLSLAIAFYQEKLASASIAQEYLKNRGLSKETIGTFRIGYAPDDWRILVTYLKSKGIREEVGEQAGLLVSSQKGYYDRFRNRIMFPIFDVQGSPVGFSARALPGATLPNGEQPAKYINTPQTLLYDKSRAMYGIDVARQAMRAGDQCLLVEGQMDLLLSVQAGVKQVVAVSGTALTLEHVTLIRRFTDNLIVVLDADEAGFHAAARSVALATRAGMDVRALSLPTGKDPADFILAHPGEWQKLVKKSVQFVDFALAGISTRSKDSRIRTTAIRAHIYPYIHLISSPLEQEEGLKRIAGVLDMSVDAVRADYQKYEASASSRIHADLTQNVADKTQGKQVGADKTVHVLSRGEKILHRLQGIALLQVSKGKADFSPEMLEKKIQELLSRLPGIKIGVPKINFDLDKTEESRAMFEAESYY